MGEFAVAVLGGDGIGPEVTAEAVAALRAVGRRFGHRFELREALVGQAAIEREGESISDETMALARQSDAVLFGAVGGAGVGRPDAKAQPEHALFRLRKELDLFANLRPVRPFPALAGASALKRTVLRGVDLVVIRELTGGLYYGRPSEIREGAEGASAVDTMAYTEAEIERVVRFACTLARDRRRRVTSVDKANVLSCSRLWRRVATRVASEYPDVELRHMLVDSVRDGADPATGGLRRDGDGEHVRRHPHRRGLDAGGLARHAALGQPGHAPHRSTAISASMSRSTARRRISPARARPTHWRRS